MMQRQIHFYPTALLILAIVTTSIIATSSDIIENDTSHNTPVTPSRQGQSGKSHNNPKKNSGFQPSVNFPKKTNPQLPTKFIRRKMQHNIFNESQYLKNHHYGQVSPPYSAYKESDSNVNSVNTDYYTSTPTTDSQNPIPNQLQNNPQSLQQEHVNSQNQNGREGQLPYDTQGISLPQNYPDPNTLTVPQNYPDPNALREGAHPINEVPDYRSLPSPYYAQNQQNYPQNAHDGGQEEPQSQEAPYMGKAVAEVPQKPASSSYGFPQHIPGHPEHARPAVSEHYYDEHVTYDLHQGAPSHSPVHGLHHLGHSNHHSVAHGPHFHHRYHGVGHR